MLRLCLALLLALCAAQPSLNPAGLDADMEKLNEYIQADKTNEQSVETLYADLQHRFSVMKADLSREDRDQGSLREELKKAQQDLAGAHSQVSALTEQLAASKAEVARLKSAKLRALTALGLEAGLLEGASPNATKA